MNSFIKKIQWCKKYLFEILVLFSVLFIVVYALFRIGKTGSWDTNYYYDPYTEMTTKLPKRSKDSNGELRTRAFLEKYFQKSFSKSRPDFMVNPVTGSKYNLELDCYNESLRLAIEYNGSQHYKYNPFFHKNKEAFYNQKYRDELKRIRCKELGITLIEIPYTEDKNLENYLLQQLKIHGY